MRIQSLDALARSAAVSPAGIDARRCWTWGDRPREKKERGSIALVAHPSPLRPTAMIETSFIGVLFGCFG